MQETLQLSVKHFEGGRRRSYVSVAAAIVGITGVAGLDLAVRYAGAPTCQAAWYNQSSDPVGQ
jgi:hypothetical protein